MVTLLLVQSLVKMSPRHIYIFSTIFRRTLCTILCHLYNLKKVKNTHGGTILLVKLQACYSKTPPYMLFLFCKLYKWYQIAQSIIITQSNQSKKLFFKDKHPVQIELLFISRSWRDAQAITHANQEKGGLGGQ